MLNSTQWMNTHVTVTRQGRRAAVMVPPDWYDAARRLVTAAEYERLNDPITMNAVSEAKLEGAA